METVIDVAFLVTPLFKSSSLLLNVASNPTDCSRPTSDDTCAMKVVACKCQLAALLPQAPQHSAAGITTYSANYETAQHPLSRAEWFQSLRGKGQALHGPLLNWIALQVQIRLAAAAPLAREFCLVRQELPSYLENARLFHSLLNLHPVLVHNVGPQ